MHSHKEALAAEEKAKQDAIANQAAIDNGDDDSDNQDSDNEASVALIAASDDSDVISLPEVLLQFAGLKFKMEDLSNS